ncbi:MAG: hypothetical protein AAF327_18160, partial [Cyanobacteria bacterium P01_A01_bin.37]
LRPESEKSDSLILIAQQLLGVEPSILQELLENALQIKTKEPRAKALKGIASQPLHENVMAKALMAVARNFDDVDIPFVFELAQTHSKTTAIELLYPLAEQFPEELALQFPGNQLSLALDVIQTGLEDNATKLGFLSALAPRLPISLFPTVLREIETCFEENRDQQKARRIDDRRIDEMKASLNKIPVEKLKHQAFHLSTPLPTFFEHYQLPITDQYLQREFDKLRHDALETAILPPITLTDMSHEIFNLVRSFSFVGEVGEDPDDHLVSESAMVDSLNGNNPASSPSHQETQDMA